MENTSLLAKEYGELFAELISVSARTQGMSFELMSLSARLAEITHRIARAEQYSPGQAQDFLVATSSQRAELIRKWKPVFGSDGHGPTGKVAEEATDSMLGQIQSLRSDLQEEISRSDMGSGSVYRARVHGISPPPSARTPWGHVLLN